MQGDIHLITVAGKGLIDAVPVGQVRTWEKDFREALRLKHADALATVTQTGKLSDETAAVFEQEATDLASKYAG